MEEVFLTEKDLAGRGTNRAIYFYPKDKTKCIKVIDYEKIKEIRKKNSNWYKRIRPLCFYGENRKDLRFYKDAESKNEVIYDCVPRYYGQVKTNFGKGILIDYISDTITLSKYLKQNGLDEKFLIALKYFIKIAYENAFELRDLHLNNYLIKTLPEGELRIYVIDGLGNANVFKLSSWFKSLGKLKVKRRLPRLLGRIAELFPEKKGILNVEYFLRK